MATVRSLPWLWTPVAKNPVTNNVIVKAGGGVVYGVVANNLTAGLLWLGIFNTNTQTAAAPNMAELIMALPIPASGSLVITPQSGGGIVECTVTAANNVACLAYAVYGGADPTVNGGVVANTASVQLAYV